MSYAHIHGSKSRKAYHTGSAIVGSAPYGGRDGIAAGMNVFSENDSFANRAGSRRYDARGSQSFDEYGATSTNPAGETDALTKEFNRYALEDPAGNAYNAGMSIEFASCVRCGDPTQFHNSPVRPSMEFAAGGSGTPPAHKQTSLALLKKKMSRSGSKSKIRSQRSSSAKRRSTSPNAEVSLARSNSERSISSQKCTRQSGCTCSQCEADNAFKSMLRGDSGNSRKPKNPIKRPEWNSDFATPATHESNPLPEQNKAAKPAPKHRNPSRKVVQERPPWNSDFASDYDPKPEPETATEPQSEPQHVQQRKRYDTTLHNDTQERNDDAYYDKMRAEMGGKTDFMDQMTSKPTKSSRSRSTGAPCEVQHQQWSSRGCLPWYLSPAQDRKFRCGTRARTRI